MDLKTTLDMVTNTWSRSILDLHISPTEFYAKLGAEFVKLEIPGAKISRKWWKESKIISAKREYLRIERDRIVFDICCAPFGRGTFISSWECIVPFCLSLMHIFGMFVLGLLGVAIMSRAYWNIAGDEFARFGHGYQDIAAIVLLALSALSVLCHIPLWWFISQRRQSYVFVNTNIVSDIVCGMTIIGPILLMWAGIRPTYYQLDSAAVFHGAIHQATMDVLEGYLTGQNLRVLTEEERAPVMREFVRRQR